MWFAGFSINGSFHQPFSVLIRRHALVVDRSPRLTAIEPNTEIWMFHFFENGLLSLLERFSWSTLSAAYHCKTMSCWVLWPSELR